MPRSLLASRRSRISGLFVGQRIGDALLQRLIDQVEAVLRIVPEFHTKLICKLIGIEGKGHQGHSRRVGKGRYYYTPFAP